MKARTFWKILTVLAIAGTDFQSIAEAEVLYRETFGRTTSGGDRVSTDYTWQTFNQDGTLRTAVNVNTEDANNPGGWPRDVANTASAGEIVGGGFGPEARGWAYLQPAQPLMITQEFGFTPVAGNTQFSWRQLNPNGTRQIRLLVQIAGGAWYASSQAFTNTNGGGGLTTWETNSELKTLIFNPAAANWLAINFNGGFNLASSPIPLGNPGTAATSDLTGAISGFGIWHDQSGTGNSRFDTFTVESTGPPPVPGDTDGDGVVELEDFNPIRDNFRKTVTMRSQGDLVPNNRVDFADFRQWKVAFLGAGGSLADVNLSFGTNVPEPNSIVFAALAMFWTATLRRYFRQASISI